MATVLILHEVNDVDRWLASAKRTEVFGPLGVTARTFVDPGRSSRVGLIVDVPDMGVFQSAMDSDDAAEAMKADGVRGDTVVVLVES